MAALIDACSIINFFNAGALHDALCRGRDKFFVSPTVVAECGPSCAGELARLHALGCVDFLDDADIPAARFLELASENDIGDGELECIAACEAGGYSLCTDDGAARKLASDLLGADRVMGGLRILRWHVEDGVTDCTDAFARYGQMRSAGGFLPELEQAWFCSEPDC